MRSFLWRQLLNLSYGKPRQDGSLKDFDPQRVLKVLVIRRNGVGDMICALPLMRNLRAAWPKIQLDILASEKNACILDNLGLADHIFLYWRGTGLFRNHYFNLPRVLEPIRRQHYDLMIAVKGGFSPLLAIITYATGIPWRVGYVPSRGHPLDFCFNLKIELPHEREHQVKSCLRLLEPLGIAQTSCNLSFRLLPEHEQYADDILRKSGLEARKWVLFNASAERYESRWTPAAIAQTAIELERRFALPMILCGLSRDVAFLREAHRIAGQSIRGVVEPPTIHHFATLVSRSRFLMCGDGGPMHVAAAMGTPVFVLFSATDPRIWKPYGVPFAYLQKGRLVANIPPSEVVLRIQEWLPTLP